MIREVQPAGPYLLGGQYFGGLIALEAAQQLQQQGEKVDQLFLIDTPLFEGCFSRMASRFSNHLDWILASSVSPRQKVSYVTTRLQNAGEIAMMMLWRRLYLAQKKGRGAVSLSRVTQDRNTIHNVAEYRYTPPPYRGAATLISIGPSESENAWRELMGADLEIVRLPTRAGSSRDAHPTDPLHLNDLNDAMERLLKETD